MALEEMTNVVGEEQPAPVEPTAEDQASRQEMALVKKIQDTIKADKRHHAKAFKNMRRDMFVAKHGFADGEYPPEHYKANITNRLVKTKTAALYAKNPKAVARRRETLDFRVWDENPETLKLAFQTVQMGQQLMQAATAPMADPVTGMPAPEADIAEPPQEMIDAFSKAMETIADFKEGLTRRQQITKIGKTLEILFAQAMREQKPVDFKTGAKQMVRRTCTTGVGYVELGFQRETGPRPGMTEKLADARTRLDHLRRLTEEFQEGEIEQDDAEMAELEASVAALEAEPEIVLREGLIFDFPQSTRVIPDKLTTNLTGFIGARHITLEYLFTAEEVEEMFQVDLKKKFKGYSVDGKADETKSTANDVRDDDEPEPEPIGEGVGMVCVWKHYDKPSGLVYYVVDGHSKLLRPAAAPDVFVEDFWPVYALTFNGIESETDLFPPSDVALMLDMQMEYNRSRQGMREHRKAARPRYVVQRGMLQQADMDMISRLEPFEIAEVDLPNGGKISDVLDVLPVPGVDPNLYETGQLFTDVQLVVGSSEAQFGGTARATATESAIAANSSASADGSSVDDLDAFLTVLARASGQIFLREMSTEQVMKIAGPGAVWPDMTLADIADELFLEIEAGSTGKPNQAVEINNLKELLPFLIQMPGIAPSWLAKQTLQRMDDKLDLTEALADGIPSIVMQNSMQQPGTGDPSTDPKAQGPQGSDKNAAPPQQGGSGPAFGSNQV